MIEGAYFLQPNAPQTLRQRSPDGNVPADRDTHHPLPVMKEDKNGCLFYFGIIIAVTLLSLWLKSL
jgi:hypothetical protein